MYCSNGRLYPKHIIKHETDAWYNSHFRQNCALGELDHPNSEGDLHLLCPGNVSHRVLDYHWEDDDLVGVVEVLPTAAGRTVREMYSAGYELGLGSRGLDKNVNSQVGGEKLHTRNVRYRIPPECFRRKHEARAT